MSLPYDLALRLKKAGFEQTGKGETQWYIGKQRVRDDVGMQATSYYFPTLEELVDACGDRFGKLEQERKWWYAYSDDRAIDVYGSTPLIAVTHLWLAINEKV